MLEIEEWRTSWAFSEHSSPTIPLPLESIIRGKEPEISSISPLIKDILVYLSEMAPSRSVHSEAFCPSLVFFINSSFSPLNELSKFPAGRGCAQRLSI